MKLKTQLAIIVAFLQLYAVGVSLSYLIQRQAQQRLEASFEHDLAVLAKLPRLRDRVRLLEQTGDQYLLTRNPLWLDRRREAVADVRELIRELAAVIPREQRRSLQEFEADFAEYAGQQRGWIGARRTGRMGAVEAERIAGRSSPLEDVAEALVDLRDLSLTQLELRRQAVNDATRGTFAGVLIVGVVLGALLALYISRYMVRPVARLEAAARAWQLGTPWSFEVGRVGPEAASLARSIEDLTGRLNSQYQQARELGQLKTQLVAMVSHEFNNALTVMNGLLVLLQESEGDPERDRERYYRMLKANVQSLNIAAKNLLNMGRLESGRFAVEPRRTDLASILQDAARRLELLYERKSLKVLLDLPAHPVPALADPEALTLVITNLFMNAIKYTPEGGSITLAMGPDARDPRRLRVSVRDTGIGIAPEDRERIFSGYYRTEGGRRAAQGFGVGLALARSLVQAHDGELEVESAQGQGSEFSFTLPLWDDASSTPLPSPERDRIREGRI